MSGHDKMERIDCEEEDKNGMGPTETCHANEAVSTRRGARKDTSKVCLLAVLNCLPIKRKQDRSKRRLSR